MKTTTQNQTELLSLPRGIYNEILWQHIPRETARTINLLIEEIKRKSNWEFGISSDLKGRNLRALNFDVYGISHDIHTGEEIFVIQVREFYRRKQGYYPEIRKSYFLIGYNEDGTAFAHPVSAYKVQAAAKRKDDVCIAAQDWIFGCDYTQVIRQGDIALVPVKRLPIEVKMRMQAAVETDSLERLHIINESHMLLADAIVSYDDTIYVFNPALHHAAETHADIVQSDWFRVVVGREGRTYDFAAATID